MRARVRVLAGFGVAIAVLLIAVGPAGARTVVPDGGLSVGGGSLAEAMHEIDLAKSAGAPWVTMGTTWEELEPQPDAYRSGGAGSAEWSALEAKLAYAKAQGLQIELRVTDSPSWASGRNGRNDPPTPANRGAYADFLRDLATRMAPYVDAYSAWNEPNIPYFWSPVDPVAFAGLQKAAYPAFKAGDPTAKVLLAPIAGISNAAYDFLEDAYAAGIKGSVDVIAWQIYPLGPPEQVYLDGQGRPAASSLPGQRHLGDLIARLDPGKRVWLTELSWSTCINCSYQPGNGATEAQQADYLERAFAYRRRYLSDITDRIFWYAVRDAGGDRRVWEYNHGLLHQDFSPKPAFAAFTRVGVEVPDGAPVPSPVSVATPVGAGGPSGNALPTRERTSPLPPAAQSATGRVVLGRPTLRARRGIFTVTVHVTVRGGSTRIRFEGFRGTRWRGITTVRVPRSGKLTVRFVDRAYVGVRLRATVPGRKGWRAARVIRVPVRSLNAGRR